MANNIVGGAPNAVVAKSTVSFATAGITALNTEIIYLIGSPLKSYVPGRAINGISGFEENKGYYLVAKLNMDLTAIVVPPLTVVVTDSTLLNGLVASWDFEQDTGNFLDSTTNALALTRTGGVTTANPGKIAKDALLNGTNAYLTAGSNALLSPNATNGLTVAGWFAPDLVGSARTYFNKWGITSGTNKEYLCDGNNTIVELIVNDNTNTQVSVNTPLVPNGSYKFICARISNTQISLSVNNGTPVTAALSNAPKRATSAAFTIGVLPEDALNFMTGNVDAVGVWNRVLTDAEVTEFYNAGAGKAYPFN